MNDSTGMHIEDAEGEELAKVIVNHWHTGAGSTLFAEEVIFTCEATGISADAIADIINAVNDYRGHDSARDTLSHAFVPAANRRAVCDLLDRIQALCVRM